VQTNDLYQLGTLPGQVPDVTVTIPVYNKIRDIKSCIESVLSQKGVTFEVICVDDCSTDGSWDIVVQFAKNDARVRLFKNASNKGAGHSRNIGISQARGCYIQFVDADDLLPPDSLATRLESANRTGADAVRGALQILPEGVVHSWITEIAKEWKVGNLLTLSELWIPWGHTCFLISREFLMREQIRFPDLIAGEDGVFLARVLTQARRLCITPKVAYIYRLNDLRPQPGFRTVQDYIESAMAVKMIYAGKYSKCWSAYQKFIVDDIRLLLSKANVSHEDFQALENEIREVDTNP
jgi:succinoglycan biosynthesis protein ExoO